MSLEVVLHPLAESDLSSLYDFILDRSGDPVRAVQYVRTLHDRCLRIGLLPEQGTRRDDLGPGLRVIGLRRRVTIVFRVGPRQVEILRILYAGRDVAAAVRSIP